MLDRFIQDSNMGFREDSFLGIPLNRGYPLPTGRESSEGPTGIRPVAVY